MRIYDSNPISSSKNEKWLGKKIVGEIKINFVFSNLCPKFCVQ